MNNLVRISPSAVTSNAESVTPALAMSLLKTQALNRPLSPGIVCSYAEQMLAGQWRVTNQGVGIDDAGVLIDGQHRLAAVVQAGIPVQMMVTRGMHRVDRDVIDCGRTQRISDRLAADGVKNARDKFAVVRLVAVGMLLRRAHLSVGDAKELLDAVGSSIDTVLEKSFVRAPVRAGLFVALVHSGTDMRSFVSGVLSGEGLSAGDPAHTLREKLLAEKNEAPTDQLLRTLAAARAYAEGKTYSKSYAAEGGRDFFRPGIVAYFADRGIATEGRTDKTMAPPLAKMITERRKSQVSP